MKIIEYEDKYLEDVRNLLTELEEYIVSIDKDELDHVHSEYREKMALIDLDEVKNKNGKCYIALENDKVVGLIMGIVRQYEDNDYLDYKCPKAGEITELIISKDYRNKNIGCMLMEKLEAYFKKIDCKYIHVAVFAYNKNAISFYNSNGYHNRMHNMIKKVG